MKEKIILAIATLARYLVGGEIWGLIIAGVTAVEEEPIEGVEKKKIVLSSIRPIATSLAGWALGIAIDVAVGKMSVDKGEKVTK
jgi:hypothetical protein